MFLGKSWEKIIVLKWKERRACVSDARIEIVRDVDGLQRLKPHCSRKLFLRYINFINEGQVVYLASLKDELVHWSWLQPASVDARLTAGLSMKLPANSYFIHYCFTLESARGRGIFSHVLSAIVLDRQKESSVFIAISELNHPSLRAARKAGFQPYQEVDFWRFPLFRRLLGGVKLGRLQSQLQ